MKLKYMIFTAPLLLFIEIYTFSWMVELLRQQSDIAVIIGVLLACVFVVGNYFLINYLITIIKKPKQNEKNNSNS